MLVFCQFEPGVSYNRSSHRRCSVRKGPLKFRKIHRKTPVPESIFRSATLLKKRLCYKCFPVDFVKLQKIPQDDCFCYKSVDYKKILYLIWQNNVGQNFRRTKFFVGQNFRHHRKISSLLSDKKFCPTKNFVHFWFSLFRLNINWSLYTAWK